MNASDTRNNASEVRFEELVPEDTVVLETENSTYTFRMRDNERRLGVLEGGNIAEPREAVASGAVIDGEEFWGEGIRNGGRALFFLVTPANSIGFNRLLTSDVENIRVLHRAA